MGIYIIKRGPKCEFHKAPFHPVIICEKKRIAKWEAGATDEKAWVWSTERGRFNYADGELYGGGFLLERWNGLDIDYGHVVREVGPLPDGTHTGFFHQGKDKEPWNLICGAVWWDDKKAPSLLLSAGVVYPSDKFTQQRILDSIADDGWTNGMRRKIPEWWPVPLEATA